MPRFVASLPNCQLAGSGTHNTNLPLLPALCAHPQRVREDSEAAFAFLQRHCAQLNFNIQTSFEMAAAFGVRKKDLVLKGKEGRSPFLCWVVLLRGFAHSRRPWLSLTSGFVFSQARQQNIWSTISHAATARRHPPCCQLSSGTFAFRRVQPRSKPLPRPRVCSRRCPSTVVAKPGARHWPAGSCSTRAGISCRHAISCRATA